MWSTHLYLDTKLFGSGGDEFLCGSQWNVSNAHMFFLLQLWEQTYDVSQRVALLTPSLTLPHHFWDGWMALCIYQWSVLTFLWFLVGRLLSDVFSTDVLSRRLPLEMNWSEQTSMDWYWLKWSQSHFDVVFAPLFSNSFLQLLSLTTARLYSVGLSV